MGTYTPSLLARHIASRLVESIGNGVLHPCIGGRVDMRILRWPTVCYYLKPLDAASQSLLLVPSSSSRPPRERAKETDSIDGGDAGDGVGDGVCRKKCKLHCRPIAQTEAGTQKIIIIKLVDIPASI